MTQQIVLSLRRLQRASRQIASGQFDVGENVAAPGEIGDLVRSFSDMVEALNQAEAQRTEVLENVAHEFRTPLSSLRGNLEGIQDGLFTLEDETLEVSLREVARLERLVTDLSVVAQAEKEPNALKLEQVSLERICLQTLAALRPLFIGKGVSLHCLPIPPSLTVKVDPQRTAQILANLLTNALRHASAGGQVVIWAESKDDGWVTMNVQDNGEGISKEMLPYIFTRFIRGDPARGSKEGSGSGVGLTIAKHYTEAQGGTIGVDSQLGEGTRFWFTLPRLS